MIPVLNTPKLLLVIEAARAAGTSQCLSTDIIKGGAAVPRVPMKLV
jgi:hypothetical protein